MPGIMSNNWINVRPGGIRLFLSAQTYANILNSVIDRALITGSRLLLLITLRCQQLWHHHTLTRPFRQSIASNARNTWSWPLVRLSRNPRAARFICSHQRAAWAIAKVVDCGACVVRRRFRRRITLHALGVLAREVLA
jgi:hypothetical protein